MTITGQFADSSAGSAGAAASAAPSTVASRTVAAPRTDMPVLLNEANRLNPMQLWRTFNRSVPLPCTVRCAGRFVAAEAHLDPRSVGRGQGGGLRHMVLTV
jgi:hypothetical protein